MWMLVHILSLIKVKAETDQFTEGLEVLGLLSMVKKYPALLMPLFVPMNTELSKGRLNAVICTLMVNLVYSYYTVGVYYY